LRASARWRPPWKRPNRRRWRAHGRLYNSGDYEGAIDAASVSRRETQWADASSLVIARARLERYRQSMNAMELADAREAWQAVRVASLSPREQVDLLIGLGQALYLGEVYGPPPICLAPRSKRARC
jgi:hypothetical protein